MGQWQMLQRWGSALPRELLARPDPKLALVLSAQVPAVDLNPVNTRIRSEPRTVTFMQTPGSLPVAHGSTQFCTWMCKATQR